ncbi:MAG: hypothetical protein Q7J09_11510, partial [Methanocalculus sp.]|uniref:hypothetical protein n=1 Tax=Methanocalculus sp. TaxID=2004547 RepID=UPI00272857A5
EPIKPAILLIKPPSFSGILRASEISSQFIRYFPHFSGHPNFFAPLRGHFSQVYILGVLLAHGLQH